MTLGSGERLGVRSVFCNENEGAEGGSYETKERERIWAFPTSRLRHEHGGWWWVCARSIVPPIRDEHGHPLQSRVAHPLSTRISLPRRAGSAGCRRGALHCHLTSREQLWMSNLPTVCTNSQSVRHHCDTNRDLQRWVQDNCDSLVVAYRFPFVLRRLVDRVSRCSDPRWLRFTLTSTGLLWLRPISDSTYFQSLPRVLKRSSRSVVV